MTVTGQQNTDVVLAGLNSDNALLFSTATWNDPQTVTVTAGHDADGADDQNTLTLTAVGGGYDGAAGELAVTVVDDDRGIVLTPGGADRERRRRCRRVVHGEAGNRAQRRGDGDGDGPAEH